MTDFDKSCDESAFLLGFSSLPPHCLLETRGAPPRNPRRKRGTIEVAKRGMKPESRAPWLQFFNLNSVPAGTGGGIGAGLCTSLKKWDHIDSVLRTR